MVSGSGHEYTKPPPTPGISARGKAMKQTETPPFLEIYDEGRKNLYSEGNPTGNINLCMAENHLSKEKVRNKLQNETKGSVDLVSLGYQDFWGRLELRKAFSDFMERKLGGEVGADNLAIVNGAGSAIMLAVMALSDPGESIMVPSPLYYGFGRDVEGIPGAKLLPFKGLSRQSLKQVADGARKSNRPAKVLLLTNPHNPTGCIEEEATIREAVQWAGENGVHVLMDEMYAIATFRDTPVKFKSSLEIFTKLPPHVHLIWGLSKDFCGSGLRCVAIHTRNQDFKDAIVKYLYFFQVGGPLQNQVTGMLNDKQWIDNYITEMKNDLLTSCEIAEKYLTEYGIPFERPQAAFFLYCNFTKWSNKVGGELPFLSYMSKLRGGGVLLTGSTGIPEHKGLRLCFSSCSASNLEIGMKRIIAACKSIDDGTAMSDLAQSKM
eukprot:TRINITY_DN4420_c0_g1_i1.p1 TRINITY_DN4420_c0_g1~~TRINITY_DN4420_c0_g1_i1.p1  ORF type:complete len:435 (+),score=72.93 TRINITY_DN4420_c0_g1_i1:43-1347(+)